MTRTLLATLSEEAYRTADGQDVRAERVLARLIEASPSREAINQLLLANARTEALRRVRTADNGQAKALPIVAAELPMPAVIERPRYIPPRYQPRYRLQDFAGVNAACMQSCLDTMMLPGRGKKS